MGKPSRDGARILERLDIAAGAQRDLERSALIAERRGHLDLSRALRRALASLRADLSAGACEGVSPFVGAA
jgi:hypothetical protein